METSDFEKAIMSVLPNDSSAGFRATLTEPWLQGRTGFGGLMASYAIAALRSEVETERPLNSLLVSFIGPAHAGELDISGECLRKGRSATWAYASVNQNQKTCTKVDACFAASRPSSIKVAHEPMPENLEAVHAGNPLQFIPQVTPNFVQFFDIRLVIGQLPASQSLQSDMGAWVRFKQADHLTELQLITLMDIMPPAVLQMVKTMCPVSTLTWHLQFLKVSDILGTRQNPWYFIHVKTLAAGHGYARQQSILYSETGEALVLGQQSVAIFDQN